MMAQAAGTPDGAALVEMTSEIVGAYVRNNHVQAGDMPGLIASVHAALVELGRVPEPEAIAEPLKPRVPIRKTVTDEYIISLEDGRRYQTLKKHLAKRGLTPETYRQKWGLPHDYPMNSAAYSRSKSAMAKELGLGSLRRKG